MIREPGQCEETMGKQNMGSDRRGTGVQRREQEWIRELW